MKIIVHKCVNLFLAPQNDLQKHLSPQNHMNSNNTTLKNT